MFLNLTEFFSTIVRVPVRPIVHEPVPPRPVPPRPVHEPVPPRPVHEPTPPRPIHDTDPSSPRPVHDTDPSSPRPIRDIDSSGRPIKKGTKRPPGSDADEVENLNKMKESDFIKRTDSPADVATKKSLLSQAGDFIADHPLLTLSAAGLAYYMFTTGQSLPDAVASLGVSAGGAIGGAIGGVVSGIGNGIESAISGLTGIPKEYVHYIWYVLLALFLYYLFIIVDIYHDWYTI